MTSSGDIRALTRGLQLLELLAQNSQGLPLSEIACATGLAKSSAHRLLQTLVSNGYVRQGSRDGHWYFASLKLLTLSGQLIQNTDLSAIARPHLEQLARYSGETVHLVLLDNRSAVYVDKVESLNPIRMYSQIGNLAPLHCTGVGKAILAFLPEAEWDPLLGTGPLERYTPATITDPAELRAQLRQIREQGYALDRAEHEEHVHCIAAPLFARTGQVAGAVSIAAVSFRVDLALLESWQPTLCEHMRQLNLELSQCLDSYVTPR